MHKFNDELELEICRRYKSKKENTTTLAVRYNTTSRHIRLILIRHDVSLRKKGNGNKFSRKTEQEICAKYQYSNEFGTTKLAQLYNCSASTIRDILLRNGMKIRKREERTLNLVYKDEGYAGMHKYKRMLQHKKKCAICGNERFLLVHHIDGNHYNNVKSNVVKICGYCHRAIHSYKIIDIDRMKQMKLQGISNRKIAKELEVSDAKIGRELAVLGLSKNTTGYFFPENLEKIRYYASKLERR